MLIQILHNFMFDNSVRENTMAHALLDDDLFIRARNMIKNGLSICIWNDWVFRANDDQNWDLVQSFEKV